MNERIRNRILVTTLAAGLASAASAQWSVDPAAPLSVADLSGDQVQPKIRALADGSVWISWFDNNTGGYDVRVQKLDAHGVEVFAHNGILVADRGVSSTVDYDLTTDATGNAYVTFNDDRGGGNNITVNKIDGSGNLLWGASGFGARVTADTNSHNNPKVTALSGGGVVVGWSDNSSYYLQRLDDNGTAMWSGKGTLTTETGHGLTLSDIHAAEDGTVLALWVRTTTTSFLSSKGLWMQKFTLSGSPVWSTPTIIYSATAVGVTPAKSIQNGYFPTFLTDGNGGAVLAWYDNGTARNAWIQHVNADGTLRFSGDGLAGSNVTTNQLRISATGGYDAVNDEYYLGFVTTNTAQSAWGYYAQRFASDGTAQWNGGVGVPLLPDSGTQTSFDRGGFNGHGFEVFTFQNSSGFAGGLYGWHLDVNGVNTWDEANGPTIINSNSSVKSRMDYTHDTGGNAYIAWSDNYTSGDNDVVAQAISSRGTLGYHCPADYNGDGFPDFFDFNDFVNDFESGGVYADFNNDGFIDFFDFSDFVTAFEAGC